MQLHTEVAKGALDDGGLAKDDVNGLFTASVPEYQSSLSPLVIADYLGMDASYVDTTDYGGSSYVAHVGHAVSATRRGAATVVLGREDR